MPNHITIGSDPEFSITNQSLDCISADSLLHGSRELGHDGRADTGELRPRAGSVFEHLMDIRRLIARFASEHPNYIMLAGSRHFHQPLGGHIHFSGNPVRRPELIVRALDCHLAIPILMLENRDSAKARRLSHDYGHLGNFRHKGDTHGGFEYRTLPSWLVSMRMAQMNLEIACLIAYDYEKLLDKELRCFIDTEQDSLYERFEAAEKLSKIETDDGGITNLYEIALQAVEKLKILPNSHLVMNSILTLENAIRMKIRWHQEIDCTTRWHLSASDLHMKELSWRKELFDPDKVTIASSRVDISCIQLASFVENLLGEVSLERKYYIYGILDRYGYDFAISRPFDSPSAGVLEYSIAERHYGRARENAPRGSVLIGVSARNRRLARIEATASAITRVIRQMERL